MKRKKERKFHCDTVPANLCLSLDCSWYRTGPIGP